jgi:hypothetical protein
MGEGEGKRGGDFFKKMEEGEGEGERGRLLEKMEKKNSEREKDSEREGEKKKKGE